MRLVICCVLVIFSIYSSAFHFVQTDKMTPFDELINVYQSGSNVEIPDSLALKFFDRSIDATIPMFTGSILWESSDIICLTAGSPCGAGSMCESSTVYSFTVEGKLVDKSDYEYGYGDCFFYDARRSLVVSDTLFIFYKIDQINKECDSEEFTKDELFVQHVFIKEGKFGHPIFTRINKSRKFYWVSSSLPSQEDLEEYSKDELDIMRNEIFADHGYIFKTEKWQKYFGDQSWYKPRFDDVNEKLSIIEKLNVQTILEVSKAK